MKPSLKTIAMATMAVIGAGMNHFNPLHVDKAPRVGRAERRRTAADQETLAKAEAKRARRADRNKQKGL